jgi:predicted acylesterase/phospholipase RssA
MASGPRPRPPFERIALLLQGGGALGAYQAGVYEALTEADLHPDWVAGISIGAINGALIAGNAGNAGSARAPDQSRGHLHLRPLPRRPRIDGHLVDASRLPSLPANPAIKKEEGS